MIYEVEVWRRGVPLEWWRAGGRSLEHAIARVQVARVVSDEAEDGDTYDGQLVTNVEVCCG